MDSNRPPSDDCAAQPPRSSAAAWLASACAYRNLWFPDLLALLALMAITVLMFTRTSLDVSIERLFYNPSVRLLHAWPLQHMLLWEILYRYGFWPSLLVAGGAFVLFVTSFFRTNLARYRIHCYFLALVLSLGPGLLVNLVLKEHWGRPRPREIQEFGGRREYLPAAVRGQSGRGKAFPCGHSAIGYYLGVFYFLFRRRRKTLGRLLLALSLLYGTAMGIGRMLAGAHFASDVLWSAWLIFGLAWLIYYFVLQIPRREDTLSSAPTPLRRKLVSIAVYAVLLPSAFIGALMATPVFKDIHHQHPLPVPPSPLATLEIRCSECNLDLILLEGSHPLTIEGTVQGFGWSSSWVSNRLTAVDGETGPEVRFEIAQHGMFTELVNNIDVTAGQAGLSAVRISARAGFIRILQWPARGPTLSIQIEAGSVSLPAALRDADLDLSAPPGAITFNADE